MTVIILLCTCTPDALIRGTKLFTMAGRNNFFATRGMGHVDDTALGLIIMLLGSESIDVTIDYLLSCDTFFEQSLRSLSYTFVRWA